MTEYADETADMMAAVCQLTEEIGQRYPRTVCHVTEHLIANWPTPYMRKVAKISTPKNLAPAITAARTMSVRCYEFMEAEWLTRGKKTAALRAVMHDVVVAVVNIWLASEEARKAFLTVKQQILTARKRNKKPE